MVRSQTPPFVPSYATPPGETLSETIRVLGICPDELARRMGFSPGTVNLILEGEATLDAGMALTLEKVTGVPAYVWNNLEQGYREAQSRKKGKPAPRGGDSGPWWRV